MKRFWRDVHVVADGNDHRIELDGRPLRTPLKQALVLPSAGLADSVAEEWRAAGDEVDPRSLLHTRLANTAVDRMPQLREPARDELMGYLRTDLTCYRAAHPPALVRLQEEAWDPVLAWIAARFDAPLNVTRRITPIEQPATSLQRLRRRIERANDWALVALHALAQGLGSGTLALAVAEARLAPSDAFAASVLDERFEMEQWGWDSEVERRHRTLEREVDAAARFLDALAQPA